MKVKRISGELYVAEFTDNYSAGMTFIRLSEYYESPFKNIRGKFFDLEEYIDAYVAFYKSSFDYPTRWGGYNVPGDVIVKFLKLFKKLQPREEAMFEKLAKLRSLKNDDFYLIGCIKGQTDVLAHECAHGFYYLDEEYRQEMDEIVPELKSFKKICKGLLKMGYAKNVLKDEAQAYLATSGEKELKRRFDVKPNKEVKEIFLSRYGR